jgi:phosphopantothenoylcysteine decarboxylase/phosphopantothenate--cysteine ligase
LWEALASPVTPADLAGASGLSPAAVQAALDVLIEAEAAGSVREVRTTAESDDTGPGLDTRICDRMVLGVCGCAQAIFSPDTTRRLLSSVTRELDVVLTNAASRLVSERGLNTLGARVWTDLWQTRADSAVPHIDLARSAEMVLILPASARALFALGHATCEDLLTLVVTATSAPVVVVPSMNPAMWTNRVVQENADRCRRAGMAIVEPGLARSLADPAEKKFVGGVGTGPFTPGLVSLLGSLMNSDRSA